MWGLAGCGVVVLFSVVGEWGCGVVWRLAG